MAGINSLRGLRNINLTSVKETVKRTAALTLLLSTVACSQSARSDSFIIWAPLLCIFGPSVVGAIIGGLYEHFFDPPVNHKSESDKDIYHQQ